MITLQKENVQKIVASKAQAAKLMLAGFKLVGDETEITDETPLIPANFTCIICGKTYKTQEGLNQHMVSKHHPTGGKAGDLDDGAANPTGRNDDGGMQVGA